MRNSVRVYFVGYKARLITLVEQTYVSNVTGTGIPELKKELAEPVCMAQHLRHGTRANCDDVCAMCIDRKCKDVIPNLQ